MASRPRLPLVLLLIVVLGALSCKGEASRLHGSVTCLDCAAGHDTRYTCVDGVVVAVKCAVGNNNDTDLHLHAAETDANGTFDVVMPASSSPGSLCAARVLGATQRLCAPPGLTVARVGVVVPEHLPAGSSSSYTLASRLTFFTRCGANSAAATTLSARDQGQHAAPRGPSPTPVMRSPPPAGGSGSPYGMGGLPLIYFFPFIPIP